MSFLKKFFDFKREELPVAILLFWFFFLSIAVFQILKPLKNGMFIEYFGAETELIVKLLNIVVAALGVVVFTALYNRLRRQFLIYSICGFFISVFLLLILLLPSPGTELEALTDFDVVLVWIFYLTGDLVTTLLVAGFWAYATDITDSDQAQRLFGVVGAGGVIGGWIGVAYARALLGAIGNTGLLISCAAIMAAIALVTLIVERYIQNSDAFRSSSSNEPEEPVAAAKGTSAALEGAKLALRSPYLLGIVGLMAFYEIASQVMDYQFKSMTESLEGVEGTQAFMASVYFYANMTAVIVQLFLVSFIMRKLGMVVTLLVMPLAMLFSSFAFLAFPTLIVSSLLVISDNGLNYSIQQTGRETLYVIRSPAEKYKARAFTNMFVQRAAKGVAILMALGFAAVALPIPYLSILTIVVMVFMILCSIYLGRRFNRESKET